MRTSYKVGLLLALLIAIALGTFWLGQHQHDTGEDGDDGAMLQKPAVTATTPRPAAAATSAATPAPAALPTTTAQAPVAAAPTPPALETPVTAADAVARFTDEADCQFYRDINDQLANPHVREALDPAGFENMDEDTKASRRAEVERLHRAMDRMKTPDAKCAGKPAPPKDTHLYDLTWAAAQAGDANAINCYLQGLYQVDPLLLTEDATRRYYANFHSLAQQQVEQGNVYALLQLLQANEHTEARPDPEHPATVMSQGMIAYIGVRDVAESYKYLLLLQRLAGNTADPEMTQSLNLKRRKLDPSQLEQARNWANAMYEKAFHGQHDVDLDKVTGCH